MDKNEVYGMIPGAAAIPALEHGASVIDRAMNDRPNPQVRQSQDAQLALRRMQYSRDMLRSQGRHQEADQLDGLINHMQNTMPQSPAGPMNMHEGNPNGYPASTPAQSSAPFNALAGMLAMHGTTRRQ